jgi:phenylalanyl-tRNA synthetase alpha subunit
MPNIQTDDSINMDQLLHSIMIPTIPPNRSQWKKLELALKFINKSKHVADEKKKERKLSVNKTQMKQEMADDSRKLNQMEKASNTHKNENSDPCNSSYIHCKESHNITKFIESFQDIL